MSAQFFSKQGSEVAVDLAALPVDLRRILSIQFREFIHHIEDVQPDNSMEHNPRVIGFLERCYKDQAA